MATNPNYAGYVRVSQVAGREGASFISPDVQREAIQRLAKAHRLRVTGVVEELDVSAKVPIERRELGRLVKAVEKGELGGLLVWRVSRFSRSLLDGVTVADRITRAGGRLLAEDFDSAQPMGRAILGFLLGWAEEEWLQRRAGWRTAQEKAVERGAHPAPTPLGYLRLEDGRLEPDLSTAPLVRQAFEARAAGASLQTCADIIGGSRSGVRQLLASPTYKGHAHTGTIVNEKAHSPLVTDKVWNLAQWREDAPHRTGWLAGEGKLAGLIRCAGCGFVCSVSGTGAADKTVSYSCRGRRKAGDCPARASAAVHRVDGYVWPLVQERLGGVDQEAMLEAAVDAMYNAGADYYAAQNEMGDFLAAGLVSVLGAERYAAEVTRRNKTIAETWRAYEEASANLDTLKDAAGLEGERALARQLIESVTLRQADPGRGRWQPIEERVEIIWKGAR